MQDLGVPQGHYSVATGINDDGWIAMGGVHAYLLTPVPLPGALLLFGSRLLGLAFLGRRN
jgi:uncharacterized membrane protein